jgi:hypothetical protein
MVMIRTLQKEWRNFIMIEPSAASLSCSSKLEEHGELSKIELRCFAFLLLYSVRLASRLAWLVAGAGLRNGSSGPSEGPKIEVLVLMLMQDVVLILLVLHDIVFDIRLRAALHHCAARAEVGHRT